MDQPTAVPPTTHAFHVQAVLSFALSLAGVLVAVWYLPADGWVRAFLGLGVLYLTTSTLTLAKCVRDRAESESILSRVDRARLEKLLADHDPFRAAS